MYQTSQRLALACVMLTGLAFACGARALAADGPCEQITTACQRAGFVQGDAKTGNGLIRDCVEPIIQGTSQPPRASKALPQIDPQLVASCKAKDPRFGQGRAAAAPSSAAPIPAVPSAPLPTHPAAVGAPNIVFILTDDLAWNLVQYMPHVLQMQKDGVTFSNYFVTDSLCCPSRTSIFTGRYPHDTGVFKNTGEDGGYSAFMNHGLERITFATSLAAAGYRTAMLGKYLNGYEPPRDAVASGWALWAVGGSTGYRELLYNLNENGQVARYGDQPADYLTDVLSGLAAGFIRQASGTPFFIEIATYAPHAPYVPAPRDADAFPGLRAPRTPSFDAAPDANAPSWLRRHVQPLSDTDKAKIDRDFRKRAQSVLAIDKMIGELQQAVAASGQAKNTYFVFSSDNGYHMGEHRLMPGKMTAFDEDIRVPLIVTGPGVPAGRTLDAIVENIDLCPTFTELGSTTAPGNVDGHSLVPLLHGQAVAEWRTAALIEHHGPVRDPTDPDLPAVRSGNPTTYEAMRLPTALYVEYADGTKEYHDLKTDPDEIRNAFASLSNAEKASLSATLAAISSCHDAKACWIAARPDHVAAAR
jgi:N-acetylglucosamine-6-sulfatase